MGVFKYTSFKSENDSCVQNERKKSIASVMNVLISGGGGFIGVNLVKFLGRCAEKRVSNIVVIDNFICSDSRVIHQVKNEIRCRKGESHVPDIHIIEGDICDNGVIQRIQIEFPQVDRIYHLASLASPKAYRKFPIQTMDVGYIGTKNMLELCAHYTAKGIDCKFLFSSTSEVYGAPLEHPQKESYYGNVNCYGTRSCYDCSKRVGEALVYSYRRLYNLNTKVIRIFNTYGPYMTLNDGRIVTEIIKAMLSNGTLEIYGTGEQTRSLNYIDDTLFLMYNVMESEEEGPINVGNDEEITINQLVNISNIIYTARFGKMPKYNLSKTPIEVDDPKQRRPCLGKLQGFLEERNLQFVKTTLQQGLGKTIEFFSQNGDGHSCEPGDTGDKAE